MGNVLENEVKPIHKMGIYEKYIKRPLDFILSLCAILVLSPVVVACCYSGENQIGFTGNIQTGASGSVWQDI